MSYSIKYSLFSKKKIRDKQCIIISWYDLFVNDKLDYLKAGFSLSTLARGNNGTYIMNLCLLLN